MNLNSKSKVQQARRSILPIAALSLTCIMPQAHAGKVLSGSLNTASGRDAVVVSGGENTASGGNSVVVGGVRNTASGPKSIVVAGRGNKAEGANASILSGLGNTAGGSGSSVLTGNVNNSSGEYSSILSGINNIVRVGALRSAVLSGSENVIEDTAINSYIGAGTKNFNAGNRSAILGGSKNIIQANGFNTVVAGVLASSNHANSFVFNSDGTNALGTTDDGQFLVNATGGVILNGGTTIQGPLTVSGGLSYEGDDGNIIEVEGPQGPAGQDGVDGADGAQGPKGDTGDQGIQGVEGPRGPEGPEGPEGPQGPKGEGVIPGSAMLLSYDREDAAILGQGYSVVDALRQETEGDANAPTFLNGPYSRPVSVWTGSKMIAWGMVSNDGDPELPPEVPGGAVYDPSTREWSPMSAEGGPNFSEIMFDNGPSFYGGDSSWPRAFWTGSKMIVEGVTDTTDIDTYDLWQGWIYDLEQNAWSRPAEGGAVIEDVWESVWTGSKLIVLSGDIEEEGYMLGGAVYDPEANSWATMPTVTTDIVADAGAGSDPVAVWMGDQLFVGAEKDSSEIEDSPFVSYAYDALTNTWTSLPDLVIPDELTPSYDSDIDIIWTGSEVIVGWIVSGPDPMLYDWVGYAYDPVMTSWRQLPEEGAPGIGSIYPGLDTDVFWTGSKLIVGVEQSDPGTVTWEGYSYDPVGDSWTKIPTMAADSDSSPGAKIDLVGNKLVLWSIDRDPYPDYGDIDYIINGDVYDTELNVLSPIPNGESPNIYDMSIGGMIVQSTGSELIFWGAESGSPDNIDVGAIFEPNAPSAYAWRKISDSLDGEQIYYIYGKVP